MDSNLCESGLFKAYVENSLKDITCEKACGINDPINQKVRRCCALTYDGIYGMLSYIFRIKTKNNENEIETNNWFLSLGLIFSVIMITLGFYMLFNSNLQKHPYKLYAYEILLCGGFYQTYYSLQIELMWKPNFQFGPFNEYLKILPPIPSA